MIIQYDSNNSGGGWWLKDKDWKNLEKKGWKVFWKKDEKPLIIGGRESNLNCADEDGRWLGALATSAQKDFPSPGDAIREFEKITKQDASDEGCNCCGPPHSFHWGRAVRDYNGPEDAEYGYSSGSENLQHLYDKVPKNLREAVEELNK
jgi:hypothetical protein